MTTNTSKKFYIRLVKQYRKEYGSLKDYNKFLRDTKKQYQEEKLNR